MHVDMIIAWRGKVIVLEFKTTAKRLLQKPDRGYVLQANLYTNILYPLLGATHFIIYYLSRDHFRKILFTYERNEKLFQIQKYLYDLGRWGAHHKTLVHGICTTRKDADTYYMHCPFVENCFTNEKPPTHEVESLVSYYLNTSD